MTRRGASVLLLFVLSLTVIVALVVIVIGPEHLSVGGGRTDSEETLQDRRLRARSCRYGSQTIARSGAGARQRAAARSRATL